MTQWLIRTTANQLAGPYSQEQVRQIVLSGQLIELDEICQENGYWLYLHEREEVLKQLGVVLPELSGVDSEGEEGEVPLEVETQTFFLDDEPHQAAAKPAASATPIAAEGETAGPETTAESTKTAHAHEFAEAGPTVTLMQDDLELVPLGVAEPSPSHQQPPHESPADGLARSQAADPAALRQDISKKTPSHPSPVVDFSREFEPSGLKTWSTFSAENELKPGAATAATAAPQTKAKTKSTAKQDGKKDDRKDNNDQSQKSLSPQAAAAAAPGSTRPSSVTQLPSEMEATRAIGSMEVFLQGGSDGMSPEKERAAQKEAQSKEITAEIVPAAETDADASSPSVLDTQATAGSTDELQDPAGEELEALAIPARAAKAGSAPSASHLAATGRRQARSQNRKPSKKTLKIKEDRHEHAANFWGWALFLLALAGLLVGCGLFGLFR